MERGAPTTLLAACLLAALLAAVGVPPAAAGAGLARLVAPPSVCRHQTDLGASRTVRERAMRCMSGYARERRGLAPLRRSRPLDRAARHKAADIVRCGEFSHEACGRPFTYWVERFGYTRGGCWSAGENIAWGTGSLGSVRQIFVAWIHSPEHRRNILAPEFDDLGVALRSGVLEGHPGARVWVQDFGGRC